MSEEPQKKYQQRLSQAEASYVTVSPNVPLACANCRWFDSERDWDKCALVIDNDPYPIVEGGYCIEHRNYPIRDENYNPTGQEMNPAMPPPLGEIEEIIESLDYADMASKPKPILNGDNEENPEDEKPPKKKGILESLESAANAIGNALKWLAPEQDLMPMQGFKVLEDGRFIAWWTNNFKDREDEIISEFALTEFVNKANDGLIPMPELWWMHIAGTKHGQVDKLYHLGHFVMAAGHFDSEESNLLVKDFKSWYAKQKNITMSHGFMYKPSMKQNGVYYHIRTYEISSLIAGREANPFTSFEVTKMAMISETQRADLVKEFGDDFAERIISQAEQQGKALEGQNIAFKSLPSGLGAETMLLLGAVKVVEEDAQKAIHEADESRKESKDVGNRMSGLEQKMGNYADATQRLTEKVDSLISHLQALTKMQAPASKSPLSEVDKLGNQSEADFLQKKNEEQDKAFVPILSQMKAMGQVVIPNEIPKTD